MNPLTALCLAAALASAAGDLPRAELAPDARVHATVDEAARAALLQAMPLSRTHEYGGVILESRGLYYFTAPVSNGRTGEIAFTAVVPPAYRIAAIYHTHPDESEDTLKFSPNDVAQAKSLGARSYIGVMRDGSIRVFDPATMRAYRRPNPGTAISRGEIADGTVLVSGVPL